MLVAKTQANNNPEKLAENKLAFNIISAIEASLESSKQFQLWDDLPPYIKDNIGLPTIYAGVNYISKDLSMVGQSKLYQGSSTVSSKSVDDISLCYYRIRKYGTNVSKVEISTSDGVNIRKSSLSAEEITQRIIPKQKIHYWCKRACSELIPPPCIDSIVCVNSSNKLISKERIIDDSQDKKASGPLLEYKLEDAIAAKILIDYDITVTYFSSEPKIERVAKWICYPKQYNYVSILAYCNSSDSATRFVKECRRHGVTADFLNCEDNPVSDNLLNMFRNGEIRILVLVNALNHVNLTTADTVLYVEPRDSTIEILQTASAMMNPSPEKSLAHIIVTSSHSTPENRSVVKFLKSIFTEDARIVKSNGQTSRLECKTAQDDNESEDEFDIRSGCIVQECFDSDVILAINSDNL